MKQVYVSPIHSLDAHCNPFIELKTSSSSYISLTDILPPDLFEIIGAKGHRYHDDFTKAALYCARQLMAQMPRPFEADSMGVICATEFGNFKSGASINTLASVSQALIPGQLFPNATYSSAAVTVSMEIGARGLNMTLTSSEVGTCAGLTLAQDYILSGKIKECLVLAGDDFSNFTLRNLEERIGFPVKAQSMMSGIILSHREMNPATDLSLVTAYSATEVKSVFKHLDCTLGSLWSNEYLVHTAGPQNIFSGREYRRQVKTPSHGVYLGNAMTLWQIQHAMQVFEQAPESQKGVVILTSSAQGALGCCVFVKTSRQKGLS